MNENITLTVRQIEKMQHAIGLKNAGKRGKYKMYRNYYDAGAIDFEWDMLVVHGFAKRESSDKGVVYRVTPEGIKLLERIMLLEGITAEG